MAISEGYKKVKLAIDTAIEEMSSINIEDYCSENSKAIFHLNAALNALEERKRDREKRGVEG